MFTNYKETIEYLFNRLPVFQHIGPGAYKPGLETARRLDAAFGYPSRDIRTIHIAGTNGKGSTAHSLAAVLQKSGYKVGLYTSPHLVDFRERIRINGEKIPQARVVDFTNRYLGMDLDGCEPSFFELTTIMAFEYFRDMKVDVAVIETGLGGRLDTTNIITPLLSVITNISPDHTALLGSTPAEIAREKAGIIKRETPVVIGEADEETAPVFIAKAREENAPIIFADPLDAERRDNGIFYRNTRYGDFLGELAGDCQTKNTATILAALACLENHFRVTPEAVAEGLGNVTGLTGLMGRWMKISDNPLTICDTGHNPGGWEYIVRQLSRQPGRVHMVMGFVADKDTSAIMRMVATLGNADFYFTAPSVARRLDPTELQRRAREAGISGNAYPTLAEALTAARTASAPSDMIFVGGSNFLIAELLR